MVNWVLELELVPFYRVVLLINPIWAVSDFPGFGFIGLQTMFLVVAGDLHTRGFPG